MLPHPVRLATMYTIRGSVKYEYHQIEVCVKVNAWLLFIKSALTLHFLIFIFHTTTNCIPTPGPQSLLGTQKSTCVTRPTLVCEYIGLGTRLATSQL